MKIEEQAGVLGTDIVRAHFGEIVPEFCRESDQERVCISRTIDGQACSYAITHFEEERKEYPVIHKEIREGAFLGETFRKHGIQVTRDERASFIYQLPLYLKNLFNTQDNQCFAKSVDIKVGPQHGLYARIIELYSPVILFERLSEKSPKAAKRAVSSLDSHTGHTSPFFIRAVRNEDLENYLSIAHEFLSKPMHVGIEDKAAFIEATRETGRRLFSDPNSITLVAQLNDDFLGYLTGNIHPALHVNGLECMGRELYVKEEHRRKGIGSALIQALMKIAKVRGAKRFSGAVDMTNSQVNEFYKTLGIERRCDFAVKYL